MSIALLGIGVVALAGGITLRLADLRMQTVLSGSMQPTVAPGDVAITQPVPVSTLHDGDVIVVLPPGASVARMHRIVSLRVENDQTVVTTKGDANSVPDPTFTLRGSTAFRMVGSIPFVGWLTQVRGPILIVAGLLVALVVIRGYRTEVPAAQRL